MEGRFHFNPIHIVRALQALLSILTLGLLAHVAQFFNAHAPTPTSQVPGTVAFAIFTSVLTLLVILPYTILTPRYFPRLFNSPTITKYTILVAESLSMLFWFISFVSVASFIGKLSTCRGSVCSTAKAGIVVAAFSWLTWAVTSLFALRFCLGLTGGSDGMEDGKGEKTRGLRKLKLHEVWAGRLGKHSGHSRSASSISKEEISAPFSNETGRAGYPPVAPGGWPQSQYHNNNNHNGDVERGGMGNMI